MTCKVCGMLCCTCELEDKAKAFLTDLVFLCEVYGAVISGDQRLHVQLQNVRHTFESIDGKGIHP